MTGLELVAGSDSGLGQQLFHRSIAQLVEQSHTGKHALQLTSHPQLAGQREQASSVIYYLLVHAAQLVAWRHDHTHD